MPLPYLPDGFTVYTPGRTGIRVIEHCLTANECDQLLAAGRAAGDRLASISLDLRDPALQPVLLRGRMLAGLGVTMVQSAEILHCPAQTTTVSAPMTPATSLDPGYTLLVFLDHGDPPSTLCFSRLRLGVDAWQGRAVWHEESGPEPEVRPTGREIHLLRLRLIRSATPAGNQLSLPALQSTPGQPLHAGTELPAGAWHASGAPALSK